MVLFEEIIKKCPMKVFQCQEEDIEYGKKLGEGGSEVYIVDFKGKQYAGKIYGGTELEEILYELRVAKKLETAKQCVQTYGVIVTEENIIILMELLKSNGDLYDYTSNIADWTPCYMGKNSKILVPKPKTDYVYFNREEDIYWCYELSEKQKMKITLSLAHAVKELHDHKIIHGDIKTNNMVLHYMEKKQIIKLIDFGMSYFSNTNKLIDIECKCGTMGYRAPEQENYQMNYKSDVYSMVATIVEVWNGDIWDEGDTFKECRNELLKGLRKIEKNHKQLGNLLRKGIHLNYQKRPTSQKFLTSLKNILANNGHKYKSNLHH